MGGVTLKIASVWDTSTTSSSSNPVVLALVSSVAMIPMTVPLTKIPKAVLRSSLETTLAAALISEHQCVSRSWFLHGLVLSFLRWTLFNSRYHGSDGCTYTSGKWGRLLFI